MSEEDAVPLVLAARLQIFGGILDPPINLNCHKCRQIPEIAVTGFQTRGLPEKINAKADELTFVFLESLLLLE